MRIQDFRQSSTASAPTAPPHVAPILTKAPADAGDARATIERQGIEIALLKARIDHLEIVVETARGLLGSNQERLLRRLYELPREVVRLSQQLQRGDLAMPW